MQAVFLGGCGRCCGSEPAAGHALLPSSVPEAWKDRDVAGRIPGGGTLK